MAVKKKEKSESKEEPKKEKKATKSSTKTTSAKNSKAELDEIKKSLSDIKEEFRRRDNETNPWMITSMLLFAVIVVGLLANTMQTQSAPTGMVDIPESSIENALVKLREQGISLNDATNIVKMVVGNAATVEKVAQKVGGKTISPTKEAVEVKPDVTEKPTVTQAPTTDDTPKEGQVVIYEYSDFQCPFCKRGYETVNQVKKEYGDKIKVVFKHFPLSFHELAQKASEASECARDQGKFWEYHDRLFENQDKLTVTDLKAHAKALDLDTATFDACLDNGDKEALVKADFAEGQQKGVTGTPAFFIGPDEEQLVGAQPFESFKEIIDMVLTGKRPTDDDPEVTLTVIYDKDNDACDPSKIIDFTENQLFPKLTVKKLHYTEEEAKALIEKMEINSLNAYIFSDNVDQAYKFSQVENALVKKAGTYMISPAAVGSCYFLNPPDPDDDAFIGPEDAKVTIIEFSDYQCPFCSRAEPTIKQILENYKGLVKFVYRDFPLESLHPLAHKASQASECARDQGKFWEYHDILYEKQSEISEENFKKWAIDLGLDTAKFNACLDNGDKEEEVTKDFNDGTKIGVSGTPAFFINGVSISGAQPFEAFQKIIDEELRKNGIEPPTIATPTPIPFNQPAEVPEDALVIYEYSDFQCPFCKRGYDVMKQVKKEYGDKVFIVFKHFPLSFHQHAQKASEATECARDQGKFWEMHDVLFEKQSELTVSDLKKHASDLGLDTATFDSCLDNGDKEALVKADFAEGQQRGISGTPAFFVGDEKIVGAQPFATFKTAIDKQLAESA